MDSVTPEKNGLSRIPGFSDNLLKDLTPYQREIVIKELYPSLKGALKNVSTYFLYSNFIFIVHQTTLSSKHYSAKRIK